MALNTSTAYRTIHWVLWSLTNQSNIDYYAPLKLKKHRHWTVEDWHRVIWWVESYFWLFRTNSQTRLKKKRPHEAKDWTCHQDFVQTSGSDAVMTWSSLRPRLKWENHLTRLTWTHFVTDILLPINAICSRSTAPPSNMQMAWDWFQEHSTNLNVLYLPPPSSELNRIEYLWDTQKTSLNLWDTFKHLSKVKGLSFCAEFKNTIYCVWSGLDFKMCLNTSLQVVCNNNTYS